VIATYRIYLRTGGRIICRHEFGAPGDGEARQLAQALAEAAADICDSFEVWQGGRVVAGPETVLANGHGAPPALRALVLDLAEVLLRSDWEVARSARLLARRDEWRARPDASLLERVIRDAVAATGADTGNIQLCDGAGHLRIAAQQGLERDFLDFFAVVKDDDTSCGRALNSARRVIVEDVATSPIFRGKPSGAALMRAGLRSTYSTPILARGRVAGMISTHRRIAWRPAAEELRRIDRFAADAASVIAAAIE
jgi:hypothetical protein